MFPFMLCASEQTDVHMAIGLLFCCRLGIVNDSNEPVAIPNAISSDLDLLNLQQANQVEQFLTPGR